MEKQMSRRKKIILIIISFGIIMTASLMLIFKWLELDDSKQLTLYGNVDIRDVNLSFRVPGRITTMIFDEGDRVSKGMVLALLDKDTFIASLAMAKAELAQAVANQKNAIRIFERRAKLIKNGGVSQALYDDALTLQEDASARVQTAKANVDKAQIDLMDTEIITPSDGTILTRIHEPGSVVTVGQPVYSLSVKNPVWITTYVNEPSLGLVYPGQEALVYTDSRPNQPYKGHIGFISPQAEFTPKIVQTTELRTDLVYRMRVVINHPNHGLLQGMPVTVKIALESHQSHE